MEVKKNPYAILNNSLLNKGTAFTTEERERLGLHGLIPPHISTIEEQTQRRYHNFLQTATDLGKYIFLKNLQNRNEVLFYRLALEHAEELLPYIYTPTVGDASLDYSNIYSDVRGLYVSYEHKDKIEEIFSNYMFQEIDVIVVTDGSRILGLGDVGIGGMTIPIGKLALYTLFGGIHPARTLPIILDVGTDNERLLSDPLYLGSKHPRITGQEYEDFVDLFVKAVRKKYPHILLQWEDFSKNHARPLLEKYRDHICSFNDDIQGTAAVALAGLLGALKAANQEITTQKIAILGGGSAGLGIADFILKAMISSGLSEKEAYKHFYIIDIQGLIHSGQNLQDPNQKRYAQDHDATKDWKVSDRNKITLEEVIENAQPTILLGVSAQPKTFTEIIVRKMASYCNRPIIFPLSNPTSKSEADPKDLICWSEGKALVATGSPPRLIDFNGQNIPVGQCNNVYIFPGVGLGVIASKAKVVPDEVFLIAAKTLSEQAPILTQPQGSLFPSIKSLRAVAKKIGLEVARYFFSHNLQRTSETTPERAVEKTIWYPNYLD